MGYGIYKLEVGNLTHHFFAELNCDDAKGMEVIATARTKKEASEIARTLGQAF